MAEAPASAFVLPPGACDTDVLKGAGFRTAHASMLSFVRRGYLGMLDATWPPELTTKAVLVWPELAVRGSAAARVVVVKYDIAVGMLYVIYRYSTSTRRMPPFWGPPKKP